MPQAFKCPSCAAPLVIEDQSALLESCDYCGISIKLPGNNEGWQSPQGNEEFFRNANEFADKFFAQAFSGGSMFSDESFVLGQARSLKEIRIKAMSGDSKGAIREFHDIFGADFPESQEAIDNMLAGKPIVFSKFETGTHPISGDFAQVSYYSNIAPSSDDITRSNFSKHVFIEQKERKDYAPGFIFSILAFVIFLLVIGYVIFSALTR